VTQISSSDFSSYPFHHVSYLSISLLAVTLPLPHLVYHCFSVYVCFRSRGGCQIDSMIQRQRWMPKWTTLPSWLFLVCVIFFDAFDFRFLSACWFRFLSNITDVCGGYGLTMEKSPSALKCIFFFLDSRMWLKPGTFYQCRTVWDYISNAYNYSFSCRVVCLYSSLSLLLACFYSWCRWSSVTADAARRNNQQI
jgi:hypothetical protein